MYLSIIIPAYNEEIRIGPTLSEIYNFLSTRGYDYEVILVDDASIDQTILVASQSKLAQNNKLKIIKNGANRGKGFAVKQGILNSKGEYVLFSDADLSTPIEEIDKLFSYLKNGFHIVIGSRSIRDSEIKIHQPWYRELMGKIFNFLVKLFLMNGFIDTQCGFKLFNGDVAREIGQLLRIDGFSFDVEALYLAKKKGYMVREVGVIWKNSRQSKVSIFGSSLNMFYDLLRIKRLHRCDG